MLLRVVSSVSSSFGRSNTPSTGGSNQARRTLFSFSWRPLSADTKNSIGKSRDRIWVDSRTENLIRKNSIRGFGTEKVEPGNAGTAPKKADDSATKESNLSPEVVIPTTAKWLGYGGLIPFVSGALGSMYYVSLGPMGLPTAAYIVFLQMTYGASILSFLGAVHWGLAMANYKARPDAQVTEKTNSWRYGLSVIPSLIAWAGLAVNPSYAMLSLLFSFTGVYAAETVAHSKGLIPSWYIRLRTPLSVFTILSLGVSYLQTL